MVDIQEVTEIIYWIFGSGFTTRVRGGPAERDIII